MTKARQTKNDVRENRTTRAGRMARQYPLQFYYDVPERRGAWHETPVEIEAALRWGRRKARLLRWVRREMGRRLTPRERHCIEMYFFAAMSYEQIGRATGTHRSSACRAVERGLNRLRAAALEDQDIQAVLRRRGGSKRRRPARKTVK